VAEGWGFLGASSTTGPGVIALAEIAPTFPTSSTAGTFGLAGTSDVGKCATSSPLDKSISAMTSGKAPWAHKQNSYQYQKT
jgi:hypothetical protein